MLLMLHTSKSPRSNPLQFFQTANSWPSLWHWCNNRKDLHHHAFAARTAAHRLFVAAMIALRPAALSFRLGFGGAALAFFTAAQRFLCAAAIRLRAEALIVLLLGAVCPGAICPSSPAEAFGRPGPR